MIMRFRKWLAGKVLGEQIAMFLPDDVAGVMRSGEYESLPDDRLAAMTRYWFCVMNKVTAEQANRRETPLRVYMISSSVMNLIRYAQEQKAARVCITQTGDISGVAVGTWRLTMEQVSQTEDLSDEPPLEVWDGDKLVEARYSFKIGS